MTERGPTVSKKLFAALFAASLVLALGFAGCGDDDKNPASSGSDNPALNLTAITEVIREVAPPMFTPSTAAPSLAPALDSFPIWTEGDYPLLDKVFGEDDPQTLYRNVDKFEMLMSIVENLLPTDANGNPVPGTYTNTSSVTVEGETMQMTATVVISELTSATTIPTAQQGVIGTSVDLDYLISLSVEEIPNGQMQFGLKLDSTEQTILLFEADMGSQQGETESSVTLASLDPTDSTFVFKGVFYTQDANQATFSGAYVMTSEANSDFSYQMSWYSDEIPAPDYTLLGCIIGGGNKDTEFALAYRQYTPADDSAMDSEWQYDEVFGPNYSNGSGLASSYASYLNEELILGYNLVPQATVASPFAIY